MKIRIEQKSDYNNTYEFVAKITSDTDRALFIEKLKANPCFDKNLSALCERDGKVLAYALMMPVYSELNKLKGVYLSSVRVSSDVAGQGIGVKLIKYLISNAVKLGYKYILAVGNNEYYTKLGFGVCKNEDIVPPFSGVPKNNFLAYEVDGFSLAELLGKIVYPKEYLDIRW